MVNAIVDIHKMDQDPQIATGHTNIVRKYLTPEERSQLSKGEQAPELRNDDGKIIHEIEVLGDFTRFGRTGTECYLVRVPESPEMSKIQLGTRLKFNDLVLRISTRREGGSSVIFEATGFRILGNAISAAAGKPGE